MFQMVAKGKDASDLFPAVVKNVAAKNLEVTVVNFVASFCRLCLNHKWILAKETGLRILGAIR